MVRDSIWIPNFHSTRYNVFAGSCLGIVNSILNDYVGNIQVSFSTCDSAAADRENNLILINHNYLHGSILGKQHKVDTTLTVLGGLIVHEAAHFAYSPKDLTPFTDYVKNNSTRVFVQEVAATLGNIVEDIFIEAEVDRQVPSLSWMVERMNEVFFEEDGLERVFDAASLIEDAPESLADVSSVLNMLLVAKIFNTIESNPFITELFNTIRTATIAGDIQQRLDLTLAIYDRVMEKITKEECKNKAEVKESEKKSEGITPSHTKAPTKVDKDGRVEVNAKKVKG